MVSRTPPDGEIVFEDLVELVSYSTNALGYGDSLLVLLVSHYHVPLVRELVLFLDET